MRNREQDLEDIKTKGYFDERYHDSKSASEGLNLLFKIVDWDNLPIPHEVRLKISNMETYEKIEMLKKYFEFANKLENTLAIAEYISTLVNQDKVGPHECNEDVYITDLYDRQSGHTKYDRKCSVCGIDTSRWNDDY